MQQRGRRAGRLRKLPCGRLLPHAKMADNKSAISSRTPTSMAESTAASAIANTLRAQTLAASVVVNQAASQVQARACQALSI